MLKKMRVKIELQSQEYWWSYISILDYNNWYNWNRNHNIEVEENETWYDQELNMIILILENKIYQD